MVEARVKEPRQPREQQLKEHNIMAFDPKPYTLLCAASVNATIVRNFRCVLNNIQATSLDSVPVYIHFYNMPTTPASTDTAVKTVMIPANATAALGAGTNIVGINERFDEGLAIRVTKDILPSGTTAVDASEVIINLGVD